MTKLEQLQKDYDSAKQSLGDLKYGYSEKREEMIYAAVCRIDAFLALDFAKPIRDADELYRQLLADLLAERERVALEGSDASYPQTTGSQLLIHARRFARLKAFEDAARELIESRLPCDACQGRGKVMVHYPMIYGTDDADEIEGAYLMASRKCPRCAKREAAEAKLRALVDGGAK